MNVFMLATDHAERARFHPDNFLYWGAKEALQLVANVWWRTDGRDADRAPLRGLTPTERVRAGMPAYLPTQQNHPWSVWAGRSASNLWFLLEHAEALLLEDRYRFDRDTAVWCAWVWAVENAPTLPDVGLTPMPRCFGGREISTGKGLIEDYREYFRQAKLERSVWTRREVPEWIGVTG